MWNDVLGLVYPIIQEHIRLQTAAISHANKLPDELLVEVFAHLPPWDRVRAATVCHKWRDASLGSRLRLWSVVWTSDGFEACKFLLERASTVPVTFYVEFDHDTVDLVFDVIAEHLHHIRAFDFTILWSCPGKDPTWDATELGCRLSTALQGPAPMLEIVSLVSCERWLHLDLGTVSCFDNHVLHTIKLRGFSLSCLTSCAGAPNIRSLKIVTPETRHGFTQEHWSLMSSFPALETLSINVMEPTSPLPVRSFFPAALKRLSLEVSCEVFLHLSDARCFARLDTLCVSFNDGRTNCAPFAAVIPLFQYFVPASAAVQFTGPCFNAKVVDAAGRLLILQSVRCDPAWCIPFANTTRLSLGGLDHLSTVVENAVSSLPGLEELTFDVTMGHRITDTRWFRWPPLACPKLRTVNVRSPWGGPAFALRLVSDTLRGSLGAGRATLATLALDRVRISAPPGVDIVASLHEIADTVLIVDSGAFWPECSTVWDKSWEQLTL